MRNYFFTYTSFLSSSFTKHFFSSLLYIFYSITFVHINSSTWIFHYIMCIYFIHLVSSFFFFVNGAVKNVREGENVKILTRPFSNVPLAATSDDSFSYHRLILPFPFVSVLLSFSLLLPSFFLLIYRMFYVIRFVAYNVRICRILSRFFLKFKEKKPLSFF